MKAKEIRETRPSSRNTYAGLRHMNMRIEEEREPRAGSVLDRMVAKRDLPVQPRDGQAGKTNTALMNGGQSSEKVAAKRASTHDSRPV